MFITVVCVPVCDVINFEIYLSNPVVFLDKQNSQDKNIKILRTKRAFEDEIKNIVHNYKGLSLKQIKTTFLERETPTLSHCSMFSVQLSLFDVLYLR